MRCVMCTLRHAMCDVRACHAVRSRPRRYTPVVGAACLAWGRLLFPKRALYVSLDDAGHVHITDFGLSKDEVTDPRGATTFCGTPEYLAPEMLINRKSREGYGKAVDWWSLGTLIFEMLTGWPPFYDKNLRKMCEQILKSELAFPSNCTASAEARDLIRGLLQRDPAARLGSRAGGAEDIRRHPFFKGVDWVALEALKVEPPFKPKVESETDITNFDTSFTSEPAVLTPPLPSELVRGSSACSGSSGSVNTTRWWWWWW